MLIVLEGLDGAGKTTVATELAKAIGAEVLHFPHDEGVTGPMIRAYLRKEWYVQPAGAENTRRTLDADQLRYGALAFQALQIVNRLEVIDRLTEAKGHATKHLILSRYWQSGWVYGQMDGLNAKFLEQVSKPFPQADLNVLLDVPVETAMARRAARDGALAPERYEGKRETLQKAHDLYWSLWHRHFPSSFMTATSSSQFSSRHFHDWIRVDAAALVVPQIVSVLERYHHTHFARTLRPVTA